MQFPASGKTQLEGGSVRGRIPVFADFSEKFGFVFLDEADERLIAGVFVSGRPENHFREDGSEVHAFSGEKVVQLAAVGRVWLRGDNAVAFEAAEAVGKDVRGDVLVGRQELLESAITPHHHVADDEQRPAISKHFDGSV